MITSNSGGGIFYLHIVKMAEKQNKNEHISARAVSIVMMFISNYTFSGVRFQLS